MKFTTSPEYADKTLLTYVYCMTEDGQLVRAPSPCPKRQEQPPSRHLRLTDRSTCCAMFTTPNEECSENSAFEPRLLQAAPVLADRTYPASENAGVRGRRAARSHRSKPSSRQERHGYVEPVTVDYQSVYQDPDECCTKQTDPEDYQEETSVTSPSSKAVEESKREVSRPLALINSVSSSSVDPFATYPSAFPPELINSCLSYRGYQTA